MQRWTGLRCAGAVVRRGGGAPGPAVWSFAPSSRHFRHLPAIPAILSSFPPSSVIPAILSSFRPSSRHSRESGNPVLTAMTALEAQNARPPGPRLREGAGDTGCAGATAVRRGRPRLCWAALASRFRGNDGLVAWRPRLCRAAARCDCSSVGPPLQCATAMPRLLSGCRQSGRVERHGRNGISLEWCSHQSFQAFVQATTINDGRLQRFVGRQTPLPP